MGALGRASISGELWGAVGVAGSTGMGPGRSWPGTLSIYEARRCVLRKNRSLYHNCVKLRGASDGW